MSIVHYPEQKAVCVAMTGIFCILRNFEQDLSDRPLGTPNSYRVRARARAHARSDYLQTAFLHARARARGPKLNLRLWRGLFKRSCSKFFKIMMMLHCSMNHDSSPVHSRFIWNIMHFIQSILPMFETLADSFSIDSLKYLQGSDA